MSKTIRAANAVEAIPQGSTLMIGGFMGVGSPVRLIDELVRQGKGDLTIIANDTARPGVAIGKLIVARLVRKVITSHIGTNPETQRQMLAGELEVELVPQGTLAERIRAGGHGLGGVLTPTGVGTTVEQGKRTLEIDGRIFLLEKPLRRSRAIKKSMSTAGVITSSGARTPTGTISWDSAKTTSAAMAIRGLKLRAVIA